MISRSRNRRLCIRTDQIAYLRALSLFGPRYVHRSVSRFSRMSSAPLGEVPSKRVKMGSTPTITLTREEQSLFEVCLAAVRRSGQGITLRVAGGWVRDKLLGLGSDDIDIACDKVTGVEFAETLRQELEADGSKIKVAVIRANPDQSKHLETATVKVGGFEVDFVNLRTESYANGSRIPEISFGTAEEDAMRRDLTINALFYNINNGEVEDLTGRGVEDLKQGLCRTPLSPEETFMDDPLRLLRSVRFATRLGFALDPAIFESAKIPAVRDALASKVSRERFGQEFEGMLSGRAARVHVAMDSLERMGLLPLIFSLDPAGEGPAVGAEPPPEEAWRGAVSIACWVSALIERGLFAPAALAVGAADADASPKDTVFGHEPKRIALLAACVCPFANLTVLTGKKRNKPEAAASFVLRNSLKLKNKDGEQGALIVDRAPALRAIANRQAVLEEPLGEEASSRLRLELGLILRELKESWRPCLAVACAAELHARGLVYDEALNAGLALDQPAASCVATFAAVADDIRRLGLDQCWTLKPLLNGNDLAAALGLANGSKLGEAMQKQVSWQLEHPNGTAEECVQALRSAFSHAP